MPIEVTQPSDREVRVTRTFNAPRQLVWNAHTKPALVQKWQLGPPGWDMPVCDMDVRVGGAGPRRQWNQARQSAVEADVDPDPGDISMSFSHRAVPAIAPLLSFVLPFPPSVNRYYRNVGYRTLLSREGRAYRDAVCALLAGRVGQPLEGLLEVQLDLFPPDARRRDWDNFQKGVWDSLQHAGVYCDDCQVKRAVIELHPKTRESRAEVAIAEYIPRTEENQPCPAFSMSTNSKSPTSWPPMMSSVMATSPSKSPRPRGRKKSIPPTKPAM